MTYGVNAPLGLQVSGYLGSGPFNGTMQQINITANYGTSIFKGDLVKFVNGLIQLYAAAGSGNGTIGVFNGCTYTDTTGTVQFREYYPANLAVMSGTSVVANVITDPAVTYTIQSTGACVTTNIDYNADVTFATNGNTATGQSGMALNFSTIATTSTLPLKILGFDTVPGNVSGVTYNNMIVKLNQSIMIAGTTGV